jgi:hypothetical protein
MEAVSAGIEKAAPLLPPSPEEVLEMIAEIRRLRGGEHRKCPCGGLGGIKKMHGKYWAECNNCECSTDTFDTTEEAWAAWDGVE